jgi:hypothetical protein
MLLRERGNNMRRDDATGSLAGIASEAEEVAPVWPTAQVAHRISSAVAKSNFMKPPIVKPK